MQWVDLIFIKETWGKPPERDCVSHSVSSLHWESHCAIHSLLKCWQLIYGAVWGVTKAGIERSKLQDTLYGKTRANCSPMQKKSIFLKEAEKRKSKPLGFLLIGGYLRLVNMSWLYKIHLMVNSSIGFLTINLPTLLLQRGDRKHDSDRGQGHSKLSSGSTGCHGYNLRNPSFHN